MMPLTPEGRRSVFEHDLTAGYHRHLVGNYVAYDSSGNLAGVSPTQGGLAAILERKKLVAASSVFQVPEK